MSRFIADVYANWSVGEPEKSRLPALLRAPRSMAPAQYSVGGRHVRQAVPGIEESPTRTWFRTGFAGYSKRSTTSILRTRRTGRLPRPGGFARPSSPPWPLGHIRYASRRVTFVNSPEDKDQRDRADPRRDPGPRRITTESIQRSAQIRDRRSRWMGARGETDFRFLHALSDAREVCNADDVDLDEAVGGKSMDDLVHPQTAAGSSPLNSDWEAVHVFR